MIRIGVALIGFGLGVLVFSFFHRPASNPLFYDTTRMYRLEMELQHLKYYIGIQELKIEYLLHRNEPYSLKRGSEVI